MDPLPKNPKRFVCVNHFLAKKCWILVVIVGVGIKVVVVIDDVGSLGFGRGSKKKNQKILSFPFPP